MIHFNAVTKSFATPAGPFEALHAIDLHIRPAQFVAVVGRSGSGKTTLLNMIGAIDRPSAGQVHINDTPLAGVSRAALPAWRARTIGFVFQSFQLIPTLTAIQNVMLPMEFLGRLPRTDRRRRAAELLDLVGILDQRDKLPLTLSAGQQQRAAIARALANDPPLLIADEPTGNLDSQTTDQVVLLFRALVDQGRTVVIATHERDLPGLDRTIRLVDGRIDQDSHADTPATPALTEALQ